MSNLKCNIFSNVWDKDCSHTNSITTVLGAIKDGRWKPLVEEIRKAKEQGQKDTVTMLKNKLPCVTWSGEFSRRLDNACTTYNKLMVVDIDGITRTRLNKLKEELICNPWVYAYFESPSNGIKILVFIDTELNDHNKAFLYIEHLFNELYNITIDKSGKNISRLCFVSADELLYINPSPEVLTIEITEETKPVFNEEFVLEGFTAVANKNSDYAPSTDSRFILELSVKMMKASKAGSYHKGNRNNYIFILSSLLCEFGVNQELAYNMIASRYASLDTKEVQAVITSSYRKNKHKFGTKIANERKSNNQQSII